MIEQAAWDPLFCCINHRAVITNMFSAQSSPNKLFLLQKIGLAIVFAQRSISIHFTIILVKVQGVTFDEKWSNCRLYLAKMYTILLKLFLDIFMIQC